MPATAVSLEAMEALRTGSLSRSYCTPKMLGLNAGILPVKRALNQLHQVEAATLLPVGRVYLPVPNGGEGDLHQCRH